MIPYTIVWHLRQIGVCSFRAGCGTVRACEAAQASMHHPFFNTNDHDRVWHHTRAKTL